MDFIAGYADIILHLDAHLGALIAQYGAWTYAILFAIIFCETGLVVAPFLPGDSLLFTAGAFAAKGAFDVTYLFLLLSLASFLGDNLNYWVGRKVGARLIATRFVNKDYLRKTEDYYGVHGGKTIILARFAPILRTFAPFVAGIGRMNYGKFAAYSAGGSLLWNASFLFGGYLFGNVPIIKENFTAFIFLIIFVSLIPAGREYLAHARSKKAAGI